MQKDRILQLKIKITNIINTSKFCDFYMSSSIRALSQTSALPLRILINKSSINYRCTSTVIPQSFQKFFNHVRAANHDSEN